MKLARAIFAVLIATAFAYTLTSSASAAGVNCDDFATPQDAQDYFIANGGSPSNNVEGLDRDRDGNACEYTGGSSGGGGTDVPVDTTGDVPADTTDTTDVPATSGEVATSLPTTGTGPMTGTDSSQIAVLAILSLITLGAASQVNRRRA